MYRKDAEIARQRIMDLAADPKYRPFVVGYLLSSLDERHWHALVQSALEFVEMQEKQIAEYQRQLRKAQAENRA